MFVFVYFRRKGPRVYSGGVEGENICIYVCVCVYGHDRSPMIKSCMIL